MDRAGTRVDSLVELAPRKEEVLPHKRRFHFGSEFAVERTELHNECEVEFRWSGPQHYIALHDMKMLDGETLLDGRTARHHDLRSRLSFVPRDCEISGWSKFVRKNNSYVAVSVADSLLTEIDGVDANPSFRPLLYFVDDSLRTTLQKLDRLLKQSGGLDIEYCEVLALTCALELNRCQRIKPLEDPALRRFAPHQLSLIQEYILAHLSEPILLMDLAKLLSVSRFHFVRMFKESVGSTPYQYVMRCRIDRAQTLLRSSSDPMSIIGAACGFRTAQQFSTAFRKMVGTSPTQFRRSVL